ncbi:E3 ubiquitin-protein ligase TRIM71-like [Amphiura filiformis]|uniref:E3 ubiquitin-protein ligase TRIM71-like n=1 Tax=Amphiura filiformis TaxID=82378 RepID=UPI003B223B76
MASHKHRYNLRSTKVDTSKVTKEECCQKHKDQVLRWYCKTCGIPICRECTVLEHTSPEHDYVTIESATEDPLAEIKNLVADCEAISSKVNAAITKVDMVKARLDVRLTIASKQLKDAESKAKDEVFLKDLQENVKTTTDQLNTIKMERYAKIENEKENLQHVKSKLSNALEMANQVIESSSTHDVGYSTLCETLTQLQEDIKPVGISHSLSVVKFTPSQMGSAESGNLGTLISKGPSPRDKTGKWVLEKEIGMEGQGKIIFASGVAVDPNTSDILIADISDKNIKVYDSDGNYKQVLEGDLNQPHDVAVSSDGFKFVTDRTEYVKVFSPDGTYLKQFPADTDGSYMYLCGLTIDNDGNLLAGSTLNLHSISKHKQDGTHIATIKTDDHPYFLGATSQGRIVVCVNNHNWRYANIVDHMGNILHTINAPKDCEPWLWCPRSVCCSDDGIIYITSFDQGDGEDYGGIYSYTEDGEYLGCVTTDVIHTEGIALIDNDRLVVNQGEYPAKIFSYEMSEMY